VRKVPLPINVPKRGLSKEEAAEYCGVSVNTLGRHGPTPTKIGDRIIYDRVRLDTWRRYCEAGCISEGDPDPVKKAAADHKAFWRASNHLLAARRVGMWREWVWIA
jgi:hypothetical protein